MFLHIFMFIVHSLDIFKTAVNIFKVEIACVFVLLSKLSNHVFAGINAHVTIKSTVDKLLA